MWSGQLGAWNLPTAEASQHIRLMSSNESLVYNYTPGEIPGMATSEPRKEGSPE